MTRRVRSGERDSKSGQDTIRDFGVQWTAFRSNLGYYGSKELLEDILGPLLSLESIRGKQVADIGSGTGRIVNMLLDAGAAHVIAVEPSDAIVVLRENTVARRARITYVHATGDGLQPGLDLDLIVSIGVLHHIPEPNPVVKAAFSSLRPGGQFVVWLYGREGNEAYLRLVQPLRKITTQLPHSALVGLSFLLAAGLTAYIGLCRALPLPMRRYMRDVQAKMSASTRRLTVYDQLNPGYAAYYERSDAVRLLAAAGFEHIDTFHRHGYSWTLIGSKPLANVPFFVSQAAP
jgi:SAM-dependent methyltransferase